VVAARTQDLCVHANVCSCLLPLSFLSPAHHDHSRLLPFTTNFALRPSHSLAQDQQQWSVADTSWFASARPSLPLRCALVCTPVIVCVPCFVPDSVFARFSTITFRVSAQYRMPRGPQGEPGEVVERCEAYCSTDVFCCHGRTTLALTRDACEPQTCLPSMRPTGFERERQVGFRATPR
jgi:hypothetical protein